MIKKPLRPTGMKFFLRLFYWCFLMSYYTVYRPYFWWKNKKAKPDSQAMMILASLSRIHSNDIDALESDRGADEGQLVDQADDAPELLIDEEKEINDA